MDEVMLPGHHHPLVLKEDPTYQQCDRCSIEEYHSEWYYCGICKCNFERSCAELPLEINHPLHLRHPFDFSASTHLMKPISNVVSEEKRDIKKVYHCSICSFIVDMRCMKNPLEVAIDNPKGYEHLVTLMSREISFTCNAWGEVGDRSPYVCPQCDFMVHEGCTNLPRIIKINLHKHHISRTYFLGHRNWVCGVCRQKVDVMYGACSCFVCCYAVHTNCATRQYVWNRIELEGILDEIDQIEEDMQFKMIDNKVINHFSHEYDPRLKKKGSRCYERKLCQACVLPICFSPFYSCMQCDFIHHQTCAYLRLKKLHELSPQPLSLRTSKGEQ